MKSLRLLITSLVLLISFEGFSQNIVPGQTTFNTIENNRTYFRYNLGLPRYLDTANANLQLGADSSGTIIFCYSTQTPWIRTSINGRKKWVEVGTGVSGGGNSVTETAASLKTKLGAASSTNSGFLSSSDWATFNSKQPNLNFTPIDVNKLGVANGVATLDGGGKIPTQFLPAGSQTYKGVWDASTNTPTLSDATGQAGWTYRVSVGGFQNLSGGDNVPKQYSIGDEIIHNGTTYEKSPSAVGVTTINSLSGSVSLTTNDIPETNAKVFLSPTEKAAFAHKQDTLGYTPVPPSRTITINNLTPVNLATNAKIDLSTGDLNVATDKKFVTDAQSLLVDNLAKGTVGAIGVAVVTNNNIANGTTLSDGSISGITGAKISDGAISNAKLGTDISATKIAAGTLAVARTPAYSGGDVTKTAGSATLTIKDNVALGGAPTLSAIPSPADSSTKITTTATTKQMLSALGDLILDTANNAGSLAMAYAFGTNTIKVRSLLAYPDYTILRPTDSTFYLDFGNGLMRSGTAQTFTGGKAFSDYLGVGAAYNTAYKLYVQSPNATVAGFRTLNPSGGSLLLQANTMPTGPQRIMRIDFAIANQPVTANIGAYAEEKFTDSTQGTTMRLYTTAKGTTGLSETYRWTENGAISNDGDNTDSNAVVDHSNSALNDGRTGGELMPQVTQSRRLGITNPSDGLWVYQTDGTKGFYWYNKTTTTWNYVGTGSGSGTGTASSNYTLQGGMASTTLSSNTPYYSGIFTAVSTSTAGIQKIPIPKTGTITKILCSYFLSNSTIPTATETSNIYLVYYPVGGGASTLTTVGSTNFNAGLTGNYLGTVSNSAMTKAVTEGDNIEIRIQTPTTANTLPSGLRFSYVVYIE